MLVGGLDSTGSIVTLGFAPLVLLRKEYFLEGRLKLEVTIIYDVEVVVEIESGGMWWGWRNFYAKGPPQMKDECESCPTKKMTLTGVSKLLLREW